VISTLVSGGCLLLLYAVAVMVATPLVVTRRRWTSRLPRTAILVWIGALGSGGVAMLASLGCAILAASTLAARPHRPHARLSLHAALDGIGLTVTACLMTAIGGGLACVVVYRIVVAATVRRRLRGIATTAATAPQRGHGRVAPTIMVDSDHGSAVSIPGRHPVIVVSSRLRDLLSEAELTAVVEHERGHLTQRHHLLLQLADLQYRCAPVLPCARSLERSIHLLVELAADDHAARHCGRQATARALRALGAATGDDGMHLRAHRLESRTLRRPELTRG
jgi:Zn-dependent protease with chaperone function